MEGSGRSPENTGLRKRPSPRSAMRWPSKPRPHCSGASPPGDGRVAPSARRVTRPVPAAKPAPIAAMPASARRRVSLGIRFAPAGKHKKAGSPEQGEVAPDPPWRIASPPERSRRSPPEPAMQRAAGGGRARCALLCTEHAGRGRHALLQAVLHAEQEYARSEEHTSELQSRENLVCRLLLEKKKTSHAG